MSSSYKWRRSAATNLDKNQSLLVSLEENDPRLWSEKVAAATEYAVSTVTGKTKSHKKSSKLGNNGMGLHSLHKENNEVYIDDEEIQKTAQSLLNQWMNEKMEEDQNKKLMRELKITDYEEDGSYLDTHVNSTMLSSSSKFWPSTKDSSQSRTKYSSGVDVGSFTSNSDFNLDSRSSVKTNCDQFVEGTSSKPFDAQSYNGLNDICDISGEPSELDKKLAQLEEKYELMTVDSVLNGILDKQFDKKQHIIKNLGFKENKGRTGPNPLTKMQLRHGEVTRKREERVKKLEEKSAKNELSRETEEAARKMLLDEEREKVEKKIQEEKKIKEEMEKIRKEIQEQQALMREQVKRDLMLKEAEKEKKKLEEQSRKQQEKFEKIQLEKVSEQNKRKMSEVDQVVKMKEMRINLKCLQKHFHAWYNFIVEQRLKVGKAIALSEWRLIARYYNTWKHNTIQQQCHREAKQHSENMKRSLQLEKMADEFNKMRLLRKSIRSWIHFVSLCHVQSTLQKDAEMRKERLQKFLDAAKTGALWSDESHENETLPYESNHSKPTMPSPQHTNRSSNLQSSTRSFSSAKVYRMFNSEPPVTSTPRNNTSRNVNSSNKWAVVHSPIHGTSATRKGNLGGDLTIEHLEQIGSSTKKAITESAKQVQEKLSEKQLIQQKQLEHQEKILKNQQKVIDQLQRQLINGVKNSNSNGHLNSGDRRTPEMDNLLTPTPSLTTIHEDGHCSAAATTERSQGAVSSRASSTPSVVKHDPIVAAMEERERIRQEKRAKFEAAKRQKAEEKLRLAQAEQAEIEQKLAEEKKLVAEKKRQEAERLKEAEKRKAELQAHTAQMMSIADNFNNKRLLTYYGVEPWKLFLKISKENISKAENLFSKSVCRKCFTAWRNDAVNSAGLKLRMAEELYNYFLIRKHFRSWCRYKEILDIQSIRAELFYNNCLKKEFLKRWVVFTDEKRTVNLMNLEIAEKHNEERLQLRCFRSWKKLPSMEKAERNRLVRRKELRNLVTELIPDFKSNVEQPSPHVSISKDSIEFTPTLYGDEEDSKID